MSATDARGDPDNVRQHLHLEGWDTSGIEDAQIQFFIDQRANLIVDEELADTGQSDRRLTAIEELLAGHYILASGIDAVRQGERDREADGSETWYAGEFGEGLRSTSLGQQAIEMDSSGTLASLGDEGGEFWHVSYQA